MWSCERCTYDNEYKYKKCKVCGAPRCPSAAPVVVPSSGGSQETEQDHARAKRNRPDRQSARNITAGQYEDKGSDEDNDFQSAPPPSRKRRKPTGTQSTNSSSGKKMPPAPSIKHQGDNSDEIGTMDFIEQPPQRPSVVGKKKGRVVLDSDDSEYDGNIQEVSGGGRPDNLVVLDDHEEESTQQSDHEEHSLRNKISNQKTDWLSSRKAQKEMSTDDEDQHSAFMNKRTSMASKGSSPKVTGKKQQRAKKGAGKGKSNSKSSEMKRDSNQTSLTQYAVPKDELERNPPRRRRGGDRPASPGGARSDPELQAALAGSLAEVVAVSGGRGAAAPAAAAAAAAAAGKLGWLRAAVRGSAEQFWGREALRALSRGREPWGEDGGPSLANNDNKRLLSFHVARGPIVEAPTAESKIAFQHLDPKLLKPEASSSDSEGESVGAARGTRAGLRRRRAAAETVDLVQELSANGPRRAPAPPTFVGDEEDPIEEVEIDRLTSPPGRRSNRLSLKRKESSQTSATKVPEKGRMQHHGGKGGVNLVEDLVNLNNSGSSSDGEKTDMEDNKMSLSTKWEPAPPNRFQESESFPPAPHENVEGNQSKSRPCFPCKIRKDDNSRIYCDGARPQCNNCRGRKIPCSLPEASDYPQTDSLHRLEAPSPPKSSPRAASTPMQTRTEPRRHAAEDDPWAPESKEEDAAPPTAAATSAQRQKAAPAAAAAQSPSPERTGKEAGAAAGGGEGGGLGPGQWQCGKCTLHNEDVAQRCGACETDRPESSEHLQRRDRGPSSVEHSQSKEQNYSNGRSPEHGNGDDNVVSFPPSSESSEEEFDFFKGHSSASNDKEKIEKDGEDNGDDDFSDDSVGDYKVREKEGEIPDFMGMFTQAQMDLSQPSSQPPTLSPAGPARRSSPRLLRRRRREDEERGGGGMPSLGPGGATPPRGGGRALRPPMGELPPSPPPRRTSPRRRALPGSPAATAAAGRRAPLPIETARPYRKLGAAGNVPAPASGGGGGGGARWGGAASAQGAWAGGGEEIDEDSSSEDDERRPSFRGSGGNRTVDEFFQRREPAWQRQFPHFSTVKALMRRQACPINFAGFLQDPNQAQLAKNSYESRRQKRMKKQDADAAKRKGKRTRRKGQKKGKRGAAAASNGGTAARTSQSRSSTTRGQRSARSNDGGGWTARTQRGGGGRVIAASSSSSALDSHGTAASTPLFTTGRGAPLTSRARGNPARAGGGARGGAAAAARRIAAAHVNLYGAGGGAEEGDFQGSGLEGGDGGGWEGLGAAAF